MEGLEDVLSTLLIAIIFKAIWNIFQNAILKNIILCLIFLRLIYHLELMFLKYSYIFPVEVTPLNIVGVMARHFL